MSTRQQEAVRLPETIESPRAKLVYLYLATAGESTVAELQRDLGLGQLALRTILRTLRERGLIDRSHGRYSLR